MATDKASSLHLDFSTQKKPEENLCSETSLKPHKLTMCTAVLPASWLIEGNEDTCIESKIHFKDGLDGREEVNSVERGESRVEGSTLSTAFTDVHICQMQRWLSHPWKSDTEISVYLGGWSLGPSMQEEAGSDGKAIIVHSGYVSLD